MKASRVFVETVAALFILLFVYTAISKLQELTVFRLALQRSPLLEQWAGALSILVPFVELLIAILLFIPKSRPAGLYASLVIMVLFTNYLCYMILFTPHLPCSCGGVIRELSWKQHVIFNTALIVLDICAIILATRNKLFIAINRGSRKPVTE